MTDIFDAKILCRNCNEQMKNIIIEKAGVNLRAVECPNCEDRIMHPADLNYLEHFKDLKRKTFNVKLRVVGNSHTISIPKEIINFTNEIHKEAKKEMDDMVRLCFEDFQSLSLKFGNEEEQKNLFRRN